MDFFSSNKHCYSVGLHYEMCTYKFWTWIPHVIDSTEFQDLTEKLKKTLLFYNIKALLLYSKLCFSVD